MTQIINLRTARKQAARDAKRQAGTEAAARHGASKASRALIHAQAELARKTLDGHARAPEAGERSTGEAPKAP